MYCELLMSVIINFENFNVFKPTENPLGLSNGKRLYEMTAGDKIAFLIAIVWFIALLALTVSFGVSIRRKSVEVIASKDSGVIKEIKYEKVFKDLWGDLMLKSNNKWTIHYFTFFFARRFTFITMCYFFWAPTF